MIERNIDNLYLLGKLAGPSCLQLVSMIIQYNAFLDQLVGRIMIMNSHQWVETLPRLEEHLILISKIIEKCEHEVKPMHDAIKG